MDMNDIVGVSHLIKTKGIVLAGVSCSCCADKSTLKNMFKDHATIVMENNVSEH